MILALYAQSRDILSMSCRIARPRTISAILVDDEKLASRGACLSAQGISRHRDRGHRRNGLEAVKLIEDLEPDLVFLDVQMPGLDGLGVIRKLREKNIPLPYFVLATAYDQYARRGVPLGGARLSAEARREGPPGGGRGARAQRRSPRKRRRAPPEAAAAEAVAAAHQAAGEEQQPQLHRRCAGRGLRHHRRRPDHGGRDQRRRAIQLPDHRRAAIQSRSGHVLARAPVVSW